MRAFCLALSVLALSGCETLSYYGQALGGHFAIVSGAQPVAKVLADPAVAPALKRRLELAGAIRDYASRELKLPDNGSYRSYTDIGRPHAVWNVVAAPEFSLRAVQSCFPVAGCVAYRGFYDKGAADQHAHEMRAMGRDVVVYGVAAYSTLGWFDDPLLSTFIAFPEAELARLVFHELAHQLVYAKGDSTFNESFAVAVEREGVRRWLAARGREAEMVGFLEREARREEFGARMEAVRVTLGTLYDTGLAPEAMRGRKREVLAALRPLLARMPAFEGQEPNNALLASYATYTDLVPVFDKLLAEARGDLPAFYARSKAFALERASRKVVSVPSSPNPSSAQRP
jgi:predicted aminopeptidase